MAKLVLAAVIAYLLWYAWQRGKALRTLPPERRRALIWRGLSIGIPAIALLLVLSGRAHWLTAAVAALLPIARGLFSVGLRALPLLGLWRRAGGRGFTPKFRTATLQMRIDPDSGAIDGQVLQGRHAGRLLSSLDRAELDALLAELPADDRRSRWLLKAYIARRFQSRTERPPSVNRLDEEEAWRTLGLQPGAGRDEILRAHKRLMQKVHPDRGGNDHLAAKVNAARDLLLGDR
jgi:hypothetical protein